MLYIPVTASVWLANETSGVLVKRRTEGRSTSERLRLISLSASASLLTSNSVTSMDVDHNLTTLSKPDVANLNVEKTKKKQ